ncbi:MAG: hybrid sensor histidine kinase/response regulator [Hyphomonadaceae bacterium]|nr:hybrid sensor histidine kinase/response regulator [Hyphomonadaceae bacterium]
MSAPQGPDLSPKRQPMRADVALLGALAVAALLAFILVAMLWAQASLGRSELDVVTNVRRARAEIFGAALAQREAEIFAAEYRGGRPMESRAHLIASHEEAHRHIDAARAYMGSDPAVGPALDRFAALIDARFNEIQTELARPRTSARNLTRSEEVLRAAEDLHALLNSRIDISRQREEATDLRVAQIAGILLALTVGTALIGFVALRRSQHQWRIADAAAVQARESARASDMAKSRFLAVASHDMRQPLHALTLYLSALERRVQGNEAREIIDKMEHAVQSMSGMFAALVDLARMQAGVITPDFIETPLDDIVERVAAAHPGASIPAPLPAVHVRTDPVLLGQILSNLVANAVLHGGGARVTAQEIGQFAEIVIADDGPGIPEDEHGRIFEEFERLDKRGGGLGLGLTIARHLARLLDISLELDSAPGDGTRFTLRVPLASAAAAQGAAREADGDAARGAQVLVVDDNDLSRGAMVSALLDLGTEARGFANEGDFATALNAGMRPRLLIMDLRIDGELSGLRIANDAVARIDPPPRVIIVTGDIEARTLGELKQSGYAVLIKPVTGEALRQAALLELSRP